MTKKYHWDEKRKLGKTSVTLGGKRHYLYGKTDAEIEEKKYKLRQDYEQGIVLSNKTTLSDYAKEWFVAHSSKWVYKTQERYGIFLDSHILPALGHMKLKDIRPLNVQKMFASMKTVKDDRELSHDTQMGILRVLKAIFKSAQENGLIYRNPCDNITVGGRPKKEKTPLAPKEQEALIDSIKNTRAYPFVMLGLYAGLRREEILGLEWDCVFLKTDNPYISVRRIVRFEKTKGILSDKLKTKASKRDIPIPPQLVECLEAEKKKSSSFFVVPGTAGQFASLSAFRSIWRIVERRNLLFNVTPHILRHTYITTLCASGMDIKKIQYLAGHSNIEMTLNVYSHVVENTPRELGELITGAFSAGQNAGQTEKAKA